MSEAALRKQSGFFAWQHISEAVCLMSKKCGKGEKRLSLIILRGGKRRMIADIPFLIYNISRKEYYIWRLNSTKAQMVRFQ